MNLIKKNVSPQQNTLDVQALQIKNYKKNGGVRLGPWTSHLFYSDPKHLAFSYSKQSVYITGQLLSVDVGLDFNEVICSSLVAYKFGADSSI
jgi:hypothetical protein